MEGVEEGNAAAAVGAKQQQQQQQDEDGILEGAVAALPEAVMSWFTPAAREVHAKAVLGSCSAVQLLLVPLHCFKWLSEEDKAGCMARIKVSTTWL